MDYLTVFLFLSPFDIFLSLAAARIDKRPQPIVGALSLVSDPCDSLIP